MKKQTRLKPIVLTIGVFDGVHLGHQALIRETVRQAQKHRAIPAVLTFLEHPVDVLKGGSKVPFLLSREETFRLLKSFGLLKVKVLRFTRAFSKKGPEQFVQWLLRQGSIRAIVVGKNFRFGRGAAGNIQTLKELGRKYGFEVSPVFPLKIGGQVVSSSRIRELLETGRVETANRLLGRPYPLKGEVVHGRRVGRQMGIATANLGHVKQYLPKDGVYAGAVAVNGRFYRAGMNLGKRPTFAQKNPHRSAEAHLIGYRGRLYGRSLTVYLLKYLRPERKFASVPLLVQQIKKDLKAIQAIPLKGLKPF